MWFFFRYCSKYVQEAGIKVIYTSDGSATVSTPAARQEKPTSEFIFAGGTAPRLAALFGRFGGHTSRSGKRQSDEHIIVRTPLFWQCPSILIISRLLCQCSLWRGQWFIRIDQFRVTSCAALWGQTEAWLAVQSGMLSNAQAWLTAHQHAELNSLAKCFPFALTSDTHIKLWISRSGSVHSNKPPTHSTSHMIRHFKNSFLCKTLNMYDDMPQDTDIHLDN